MWRVSEGVLTVGGMLFIDGAPARQDPGDNIPPTEYKNYQDRVIDILNKMQAEKAANKAAQVDATPAASANEISSISPVTTTGVTSEGTGLIGEAAAAAETSKDIPPTNEELAIAKDAVRLLEA